MHLGSQMFTESILKVLFSFVRPDLRLLLCDDFKDYPRRGKFTEATRLKKSSMSKAFLHLIWPSYHFQNLVEQIWLRKVYTYIMHGNFMCCLDVAESIFRISHRWTFQPFNTATKPHMGLMKILPPIANCVWQKQKLISKAIAVWTQWHFETYFCRSVCVSVIFPQKIQQPKLSKNPYFSLELPMGRSS